MLTDSLQATSEALVGSPASPYIHLQLQTAQQPPPVTPLPSQPGTSSSLLNCFSPQLTWLPLLCAPQDLALITVPQLDGSLPGHQKHHHKPVSFICVLLPRTGLQKHIRLSPSCHHLSGFPGVRGRQRRLAEAELNTYQTTRSRWSAVTWPGGTRDLPFLWDL